MLAKGCQIWLPNLQCIEESLTDFHNELIPYFEITKVTNPLLNPLYLATEDVEKELLLCPDALTNETQIKPLLNFSNEPFYSLILRDEFLTTLLTPSKKSQSVKRKYERSNIDRKLEFSVDQKKTKVK